MTLWFVTPAWQRYSLSEVCFQQRRWVIESLAKLGIEARCVVVADDENLDLARAQGFDVVEQSNEWLGRKFNDGIEHAVRRGAEWISPIGSDSWVDPAYFIDLDPTVARTSPWYAAALADRLATLHVVANRGAGPHVLHRQFLAPFGFRPIVDRIRKGIDRSLLTSVNRTGELRWEERNLHRLQYIGFRGVPTITPYRVLVDKCFGVEYHNPWPWLSTVYPAALVAAARRVMKEQEERLDAPTSALA